MKVEPRLKQIITTSCTDEALKENSIFANHIVAEKNNMDNAHKSLKILCRLEFL